MQFPDFNPTLVQMGPLAIRWYGLAYLGGILLGWLYARNLLGNLGLWRNSRPPLGLFALDDLIIWITIGIIVGGRIGYVAFYEPSVIWRNPLEVMQVWHGGMSFHGGLIGVALALIGFGYRRGFSILGLGDIIAACAPIGLFFGRLANFINGELWGRVTGVRWGIVFCNRRILAANNGACPAGIMPRHPSQLYEAALEGLLLFFILRFASHRAGWLCRPGAMTGLFLVSYGIFRISLETVRNPDLTMPIFPLGLTMGMMLSVPLIALGLGLMWRSMQTGRR